MILRDKIIKINRFMDFLIDRFLATLIILFALLINISILGRLIHFPTPWVEELCVFSLPWIGLLGFARAIEDNETIAITALLDKMGRFAPIVKIFNNVITIVIGSFLIYYSYFKIIKVLGSMSLSSIPSLNMNIFYYSLPVGGFFIITASIKQIFKILSEKETTE
ncbi:MAG: TRAP transporter small permease [Spirochaetales bacterium]|nr:TRAP transporter small permease [Spirochaetales bacterium]